jgi:serine/threonine-protein kinase
VKPDNILVRARDGGAKLADLGLARAIQRTREETTQEALTVAGTPLGTPLYMAPEQTQDASSVGPPADVWSMGATLYALLTGKAPFKAPTILELLEAIREQPVPDVAKLRPDVSPATRTLIARCLEKDPTKRPKDAGELADELGAIRTSLSGKMRVIVTASDAVAATLAWAPPPQPKPLAPAPKPKPETQPLAAVKGEGSSGGWAVATSAVLFLIGLVSFVSAVLFYVYGTGTNADHVAAASPSPQIAPTPQIAATPQIAPTPSVRPSPSTILGKLKPSPSPSPLAPDPSPMPSPMPTSITPPVEPSPRLPSPSPSPSPSPLAPVVADADTPVAELPLERRSWDGHGWRRNRGKHVHSKNAQGVSTCGHFYDPEFKRPPDRKLGCWKLQANEPRIYDYEISDSQWTNATLGLYMEDGKTWFIKGHTHDANCVHELKQDADGVRRYHLRPADR